MREYAFYLGHTKVRLLVLEYCCPHTFIRASSLHLQHGDLCQRGCQAALPRSVVCLGD